MGLLGHVGRITNLSFSRDGSRLLSASEDHSARLWHLGEPASLDARSLQNRFCQETDPALHRLDGSRGWDLGLSYSDHVDPSPIRALIKEIEILDACPDSGT